MTSFDPGGTERQMIELMRRLDPARWTIHLACSTARGAWFARAAEAAQSVAEFPLTSFKHPGTLIRMRAMARWLREREVAVAHTADFYANIMGLPAAAMARVPVRVGNRREVNPDKSPAQILLQRAAYACAHRVVANSRAAAERLAFEQVPERRIRVVANGLDAATFHARPASATLRRVVVVANLRVEKGHDVLIDAAPAVLARFPDARFEFVGDGPRREALAAQAERAGVARAFSFLGHRDDVGARLGAADIFVLPSRSEAFPNAVLEAMAAGLPIVASRVGGIRELVEHERTGLLVPDGDPRALADGLCRLMADPAFAGRLGAAAGAKAGACYSFDRMVADFEQVYVGALVERGVLTPPRAVLATTASSASVS